MFLLIVAAALLVLAIVALLQALKIKKEGKEQTENLSNSLLHIKTTNMATPSAASLLIDALHPKERAILHRSMLFVKDSLEAEFAEHLASTDKMNAKLRVKKTQLLEWQITHLKKIFNKLFSECRLEDMDPLPFFDREMGISQSQDKAMLS